MRTTETTCLSDDLCLCKEEEDRQIMSLGDSLIECVRNQLNILGECMALLASGSDPTA